MKRLWSLVLLLVLVFYGFMLSTKTLEKFLHPRFKWISVIAFVIILLFFVVEIQKPQKMRLYSFSVVLILGLASYLIFSGFDTIQLNKKVMTANNGIHIPGSAIKPYDEPRNQEEREAEAFTNLLYLLQQDGKSHIGESAEIVGMVFKQEGLSQNQFVITRPMMTCCVADTILQGFVCEYNNSQELTHGQWVKIKAEISDENQNNALLKIKELNSVNPPEVPYIYQRF